jgi:agmatinase
MPRCDDLEALDADVAILGVPYTVPYDLTASRQVSSPAPAAIREQSQRLVAFLHHHDFEFDGPVLGDGRIRIVDCGDVAMEPGEYEANARMTQEVIRAILDRGARPFVLGGDHAVPIPIFKAFERSGPIYIVQIDAHIDWREERNGVREGLSSVMRRASEMPWVNGLAQVGIRGVGSARTAEVDDALSSGALLIGARELHERGVTAALAKIPDAAQYYITVDADGFDPTIAPGVRSQVFDGVTYREALDLIRGVAAKGPIVGFDLVEVVPHLDVGNMTSFLAARIALNTIGEIVRTGQVRHH